jgi:hypothetical protein
MSLLVRVRLVVPDVGFRMILRMSLSHLPKVLVLYLSLGM